MIRKIKFMSVAILATTLLSCSNDSHIYESVEEVRSRSVEESNLLYFENSSEFMQAIQELNKLESVEEKLAWQHLNYPDFKSIQDLYWEAMDEACDLGEGITDFEEFMAKYDMLYFPLEGEDAGFYIPESNLDLAYLLNENHKIQIGSETLMLRDIFSYEQLQALGRAYYEEAKPMTVSTYDTFYIKNDINSIGTEYDSGWTTYDKRKAKLKARRLISKMTSYFHTEFCFRKKTIFGWGNYSSKSKITGTVKLEGTNLVLNLDSSHSGTSSHDKNYELVIFFGIKNNKQYYT